MRYENPLYLAEEVAALDLLTDQRIAIGISRGSPEQARRGRAIMNQNIVLSLAIIAVLPPLAITGVLGLAAVVLVHEVAEVVVIANGLRAARAHKR